MRILQHHFLMLNLETTSLNLNENYRRYNFQAFTNISGNIKFSEKFTTLVAVHLCCKSARISKVSKVHFQSIYSALL